MRIKKLLTLVVFVVSIFSSFAQTGGEAVYQFLNLSTSARQIALGGEILTLTDDVNQPIWNPAVINEGLERKLSVNYTNFLADISIGSFSYVGKISKKLGAFHGSIKYLDYGSFIGADEQGFENGNFNAKDIAVSLGYAIQIPKTYFYFGANLRFITANIDTFSSTGISTDLALLYNNPNKPFKLTVVARNIGTQLSSFNGTRENLPFKVALGGSYELEHVPLKWYLTVDNIQKWDISAPNPSDRVVDLEGNTTEAEVNFIQNSLRHFILGAELFPKRAVNLRVGYNFRRAAELQRQNVRTSGGISLGFGLKINKFKLNYALSNYHSASNAHTFSLFINLDNSVEELENNI